MWIEAYFLELSGKYFWEQAKCFGGLFENMLVQNIFEDMQNISHLHILKNISHCSQKVLAYRPK